MPPISPSPRPCSNRSHRDTQESRLHSTTIPQPFLQPQPNHASTRLPRNVFVCLASGHRALVLQDAHVERLSAQTIRALHRYELCFHLVFLSLFFSLHTRGGEDVCPYRGSQTPVQGRTNPRTGENADPSRRESLAPKGVSVTQSAWRKFRRTGTFSCPPL